MKESTLLTDRLTIKLITEEDFKVFHLLLKKNQDRLNTHFPKTIISNRTEEASLAFLKINNLENENVCFWGVFIAGKLCGSLIIIRPDLKIKKCEIGYFVSEEFEGKGIVTEALKKFCDFCFEILEFEKLVIKVMPGNMASNRIANKLGFKLEGVLRREFKTGDGDIVDLNYYGLVKQEF